MTAAPIAPDQRREGSLLLLALFFAAGVVVLAIVWVTVLDRSSPALSTDGAANHSRWTILHWERHGYFASRGVLVRVPDASVVYRWSLGLHMLTGYLTEKVWMAMTGRYGWRLLALHNQVVSLAIACLFALLVYRIARRRGLSLLHAFMLGLGAEMVLFTFPDNLALFWDMTAQPFALAPLLVFLLLEERRREGAGGVGLKVLQAVAGFVLTATEFVYGVFFSAVWVLWIVLSGRGRAALRHAGFVLVLPGMLAMLLLWTQGSAARRIAERSGGRVQGSSLLYRSGLDGDAMLYGTHLDIAYGRDVVRAARPDSHQVLFRWKWRFVAGLTALVLSVLLDLRRAGAPGFATTVLLTMVAAWTSYAAVFSQSVALHPLLYDVLLAAPLFLAFCGVLPSELEARTGNRGVVVFAALVAALWISMVQVRIYAMAYPAAQPAGAVAPPGREGSPT